MQKNNKNNFKNKDFHNNVNQNNQNNQVNKTNLVEDDEVEIKEEKIHTDIKKIPDSEKVDYSRFKNIPISNQFMNKPNTTYIFAVGGLDEVGKNSYAVEHNEETIMVDYGIKFASSDLLGINGIIANTAYFVENKRPIDMLLITHGHEDHIGGIPYLLQTTEVKKICAPVLATELIKRRLSEFKNLKYNPEIIAYEDNSVFKTKYFEIDFFRVCHSIPDSFGMCIKTPDGRIVSAGDYRYDFGKDTDDTNIHKLVEMSNRGIDVFLSESTNSDQPGFSISEDNIINNVETLIKNAKGRTFVATFASNLGRIEKIIERAIKLGRRVCIMGRSMESNIKTSKKLGYLKISETDFISAKEVANCKDNQVLIVLTGSQGEEMAALNQMAEGKYQKLSLKNTDTIIMSSNPIPGNFKSVETLVNKLYKQGVVLHTNTPNFRIHSSGHATIQELQMMFKILKPKYLIPIHGESKMLSAMKRNAKAIGIDPNNVFVLTNGLKVELKNHVLTQTNNRIDAEPIYIDKKVASKSTTDLINKRKLLSEEGIFNVIVMVDFQAKKVLKNPMLTTRGCFFAKDSSSLISKISFSIKDEVEKVLNQGETSKQRITDLINKTVKFYVWKNKKKNPIVTTTIFDN
ncbi:MAG: ribonuclease J [Malacoplasma sp.]|nr:ribonuclease J [Malacoplasma sp.]MDE6894293.1 ribonuclease J [Malacoplasma sp.]MDE7075256.1 ribonuclease J [Malacoplasma sp.]